MTLLEVLVSTVLLGVGVAGLVSVATLAMRNQQRVDQRSAALCLAQEKLAEVEIIGPHIWSLGHAMQGAEPRGDITYQWSLEIDEMTAGELFSVIVGVAWDSTGGGGAVRIETWLNDYEAVAAPSPESADEAPPNAPQPPGP